MSSGVNLRFFFVCSVFLIVPEVGSEIISSHKNIKLNVQQETASLRRSDHSENKKAASLNENFITIENCIKTFQQVQPFRTADCCLTKICTANYLHNQIVETYSQIMRKTLSDLCSGNFYLMKEQLSGCCIKNYLNSHVNNNTNFTTMTSNKENSSAIANCSVNFKPATINDGTSQINSKIIHDVEKRSTQIAPFTSFKSGPTIETSTSLASDMKIRFENTTEMSVRNLALQFLDVPRGDDMHIYDLRLHEEHLLFEAFSSLMGYLQPAQFPKEFVLDAWKNRVSIHILVFQILKLELFAVIWIVVWAILTICLPIAIIVNMCNSGNIRRLDDDSFVHYGDRCTQKTMGILLHILLLLLVFPIIIILAANEQLSRAISKSSSTTKLIYDDINTFIRNTHMQMSFVTTSSTDIAIEAIRKDLEDVENLLGIPYQQELSSERGIDIALDALDELKISTAKVTTLVADLLNECVSARTAGSLLQEQLEEIARQLLISRQQCTPKDRALCYTLQFSGFDVVYSTKNFTNDEKIKQLDLIGTETNFNTSIENARKSFKEIPDRVFLETTSYISGIRYLLSKKRTEVYKATHNLDVLTRTLSEIVRSSEEATHPFIQKIADLDLWRWLITLGVATVLCLIWGLLLCGAPCGCGLTSRTVPFLISGVSLSCIICVVVWSLAAVTFILGGHGQSLLCDPLYDSPHYKTLAELLNYDGDVSKGAGFFHLFNDGNESLKIQNVLRDCQQNRSIYSTFHLYNQLEISRVTNYKSWDDMTSLLTNFTIGDHLEIVNPSLQLNLHVLSTSSKINLAPYKELMSSSISKRDLASFADQLNTVARQLNNAFSSRKIDNLAYKVRKVVNNGVKQLNEIRKRLIYKITTLEVLLLPLNKQTNQSLSHLKTIQYFLDTQAWQIADKTSRRFTARIESNLQDLYNHVNLKVSKEIGACRPLWDIFHSSRFYVCKLIVDPLNAISFVSFFLILLFLIIAPIVVKLVDYYRESINEDTLSSISHRRARDGLIIDDEGTWATPASSTPPEIANSGSTVAPAMEQPQAWVSSIRQPSDQLIPPPPRCPANISSRIPSQRLLQIPSVSRALSPKSKFSTIASRITGVARIPQISSVSRARSPRRGRQESLRLIEPICWKSGSTTPRSWI